MSDAILKIMILVYDFLLVAGTAYLVQEHGWSMWTFLLAMFFFITTSKDKT
jgi:hypothetical protein